MGASKKSFAAIERILGLLEDGYLRLHTSTGYKNSRNKPSHSLLISFRTTGTRLSFFTRVCDKAEIFHEGSVHVRQLMKLRGERYGNNKR